MSSDDIYNPILAHEIDLMVLTETWLCSDNTEDFYLKQCYGNQDNWQYLSFPRDYSTGGGIAVFFEVFSH